MNLILCGLPKSGKTTIGRALAKRLRMAFIDTDKLIESAYEQRRGVFRSCRQIFIQEGEAVFRALEKEQIAALSGTERSVISVGGGSVSDPDSVNVLRSLGIVVYLKAPVDVLLKRLLKHGVPPYLSQEDPKKSFSGLAEKRIPSYEAAAHATIEIKGLLLKSIVDRIIEITSAKGVTLKIVIPRSEKSSTIELCRGCLSDASALLGVEGRKVAIITDDLVSPLYGEPLCERLRPSCAEVLLLSFPHGEGSKTRESIAFLEDKLFEKGFGRDSLIIAVGGGVVTDVAGFVAATYCRGVDLIMVPTTLLAMVDASIGGKNGVNVPWGKNLLGCIYQPQKILIDSSTLSTLPMAEWRNGIVEMIKMGLALDKDFFEYLEQQAPEILSCNYQALERAIFESCRLKKEIVEWDETEQNKRHLLNVGHTIGHALEILTHYSLSHGEAVAIGMLVEGYMAVRLGVFPEPHWKRLFAIFQQYGLPLKLPCSLSQGEIRKVLRMDKKSALGKPRFVLLEAIGCPRLHGPSYLTEVDESVVDDAIEWMNHALCRDLWAFS